jgi:hypothetical protein
MCDAKALRGERHENSIYFECMNCDTDFIGTFGWNLSAFAACRLRRGLE